MSSENSVVGATIADLSAALSSGRLTSVDLVAKYLHRISVYDCQNAALNSVPILNEHVFDDAAAADDRRAAGHAHSVLEGIPFTVKDSYKVRGMTLACGSEAFENLIATEDAFLVSAFREAGAVLVGRTNMCPMAYGGMIRGAYGRAESPYNRDYLVAAFGSGSSQGSGVSTAASFAGFGLGSETVSSGRSPASNNAVIAYTPSKGLVSVRGVLPLYPTCDVLIPHTRTMDDLIILSAVLMERDPDTTGDFWRDQPFIDTPSSLDLDNLRTMTKTKDDNFLRGKRVAVPQIFIEQQDDGPFVSESIHSLWRRARADLKAAGAIVEIIPDLPALQVYAKALHKTDSSPSSPSIPHLPPNWNATERGLLIAHGWEEFLQTNADPRTHSLTQVDPSHLFPQMSRSDVQLKFTEPANAVHWHKLASYATDHPPSTRPGKSAIYDIPQLEPAIRALEQIRTEYFDNWLSANNYDFVAFPAQGDVARSDADVNEDSARHAWRNGVGYSHGNRALRHLGIPSVTVPMGVMEPSGMPMGLTFLGRAYDDFNIIKAGYAYEQQSKRRVEPPLTPALESDTLPLDGPVMEKARPELKVVKCIAVPAEGRNIIIEVEGAITSATSGGLDTAAAFFDPLIQIYVDAKSIPTSQIAISPSSQSDQGLPATASYTFTATHTTTPPAHMSDSRDHVVGKIARDSTMVVLLARDGAWGRPSGFLKIIHRSEVV